MSRFALVCGALVLGGCGPDVNALCAELAEACSENTSYEFELRACMNDGAELESLADDADCNDEFDAYVGCVEEQRCSWNTECTARRATLDRCTGVTN